YNRRAYFEGHYPGAIWLQVLIHGHPERFKHAFGMRLHVFNTLLNVLRQVGLWDSRCGVKVEEQLAIFLH
ncbi:hypothetical protein OBBRIDRAFT_705566, partial [Obba rivulosa]